MNPASWSVVKSRCNGVCKAPRVEFGTPGGLYNTATPPPPPPPPIIVIIIIIIIIIIYSGNGTILCYYQSFSLFAKIISNPVSSAGEG